MRDSGDGISVSLDEIALQMRAIAGRLSEFPSISTVGVTTGHADGASQTFRFSLNDAGSQLSLLTAALTMQLDGLQTAITTTGNELVAADEAVASDVGALEQILSTVAEPVTSGPSSALPSSTLASSTLPSSTPPPSTSTESQLG